MTKLILAVALMAAVWWLLKPRGRKPLPAVDRACDVLGVTPDATPDDVRAAHRRLLAGVHPDRGGSAELTRQINDARDVLLRRLRE